MTNSTLTFLKIIEENIEIGIDFLKDNDELIKAEALEYLVTQRRKPEFYIDHKGIKNFRFMLTNNSYVLSVYHNCIPTKLFSPIYQFDQNASFNIMEYTVPKTIWKSLICYEHRLLLEESCLNK